MSAAAPVAPPNGPVVRKGTSPWADAWRRLRKNKMAMLGLWVVVVMSVLSALAQWIAPFDATYPETWIQAQAPGYVHVDVLNRNTLEVGKPAEVREGYREAGNIRFLVREGLDQEDELRVVVKRGKVSEITLTAAAERLERVDASEAGHTLTVLQGAPASAPLEGLLLEVGQPLPPGLDPGKPSAVLMLRHAKQAGSLVLYEAWLEEGRVRRLTRDGEAVRRVELEGRQVVSVRADGDLRTHTHLLGTDLSGRDLLSRILYGGQISLMVGLVATVVSLVIGVVYGAVSGYVGGRTDMALMAIVDILFGIPYMFLVILLLVNFGRDLIMLFVALGAVQWLTMARIVRGQVLSLKQKEFVEAARMSGTGHTGIIFRHLIPNTLGVVVVYTTLTVPAVILQESFLAFIGLTVEVNGKSLDSWGALVKSGMDALGNDGSRAWLLLWPSFAMAITLFSLNFLGDGLRDALDPQQRGRT